MTEYTFLLKPVLLSVWPFCYQVKVSKMWQRNLTLITGVVECFVFAGAFFGWANIYPVLRDEKYFTTSCTNDTTKVNGSTEACKSQEEALALVFTIASAAGIFASIFVGVFFDRFGMWCTRTVLVNLAAISYVVVGLSDSSSSFLLYAAFSVINAAGFGLMLTNCQMANLYPKLRGMYSYLLAGAFNSAPVLYLLMNKLYYSGLQFSLIVSLYACGYFVINLRTFLLTPKHSIPFVLPLRYLYGYRELCCPKSTNVDIALVEKSNGQNDTVEKSATKINPDDATFSESLRKVYFYTGMVAVVIIQFVTNFYISTLDMFLESLLGSHERDDIDFYTTVFGILQCCTIVFAPINGLIVEHFRKRFSKTADDYFASLRAYAIGFFMGSVCLVSMVVCALIPIGSVQIVGMVAHVLCKICFFGVWIAFLTLAFPSQHFGKVFGLMNLVNGLVLLLQYPLTLLLTRVLDRNFVVLNSCLLALSCLTLIHPFYLLRLSFGKKKVYKEADVTLINKT